MFIFIWIGRAPGHRGRRPQAARGRLRVRGLRERAALPGPYIVCRCMYIYIYIYIYMYTHICMYVYVYIYIYVYAYSERYTANICYKLHSYIYGVRGLRERAALPGGCLLQR